MTKRVLVTGAAGLVGSECCRLFAEEGFEVVAVDNFARGSFFPGADTSPILRELQESYAIEHHAIDIRDERMGNLAHGVDAVIHAAAQPSHPKSVEIPLEDFQVNAYGTLLLLEALRLRNPEAVLVFCSSNKAYGEAPNYFSYRETGRRLEPADPGLWDGFDERLSVDQSLHTPFGVSKLAADLYTQEYARLYGLRAGIFRMGCITGRAARAVEQHNWLPFFLRKALAGEELTVFGHGGYQVRDLIHARDLARLFLAFVAEPRSGEVYNVGGGRENSLSVLESIDWIGQVTGRSVRYRHGPEREADHRWWITNSRKVRSHYPSWRVQTSLAEIFTELHADLSAVPVGGSATHPWR